MSVKEAGVKLLIRLATAMSVCLKIISELSKRCKVVFRSSFFEDVQIFDIIDFCFFLGQPYFGYFFFCRLQFRKR